MFSSFIFCSMWTVWSAAVMGNFFSCRSANNRSFNLCKYENNGLCETPPTMIAGKQHQIVTKKR